ncbi:MAG: hypothetical protein MI746_01220 [Pseudomonadales bacterium]|nr:hypothetical protein [Pseudomonadales bacterium]
MTNAANHWHLNIATTATLLFVLPTLAININYFIAASEGFVPWCIPYWDSCTSISATGRQGTAYYFFKATMLPIALLYLHYWFQCSDQLARFGHQKRTVRYLGLFAVVALVMYTVALGAAGDNFRLARRIGIIFYFTLTYLCQLLVVYRLDILNVKEPSQVWQLRLCLIILSTGVLTLFLDVLLSNYDDYEDAFEWTLALLIHINFLLAGWGWKNIDRRAGWDSA